MASNHTEHYELPLWEPDDRFLRTEFNEAHQNLDSAIAQIAAAVSALPAATDSKISSALTPITAELSQLSSGAMKFACSTYTGDGANSRTFTFDFKPYLFISISESIFASLIVAIRGMGITSQSYVTDATKGANIGWGENQLTLSKYNSSADVGTINNFNQGSYAYFAIGQ